jgi:urease accessory protein
VVTNDIYTTEDADFLRRHGVLDDERITAVETGCCPHTAIRDDITANLEAVKTWKSGWAGSTWSWSRAAATTSPPRQPGPGDSQVFVLDVAGGDKVPRKGGPGVTTADLLVINKTDLAPLVGADLAVMDRDAARVRDGRPVAFVSLAEQPDAAPIVAWSGPSSARSGPKLPLRADSARSPAP